METELIKDKMDLTGHVPDKRLAKRGWLMPLRYSTSYFPDNNPISFPTLSQLTSY